MRRISLVLSFVVLAVAGHAHALSITDLPSEVQADVSATYGGAALNPLTIGAGAVALSYNSSKLGDSWLVGYTLGAGSVLNNIPDYTYPGCTYFTCPPTTSAVTGTFWLALSKQYTPVGTDYYSDLDPRASAPNKISAFFSKVVNGQSPCGWWTCTLGMYDGGLQGSGGSSHITGEMTQYGPSLIVDRPSGLYGTVEFAFLYLYFDADGVVRFNSADSRTTLYSLNVYKAHMYTDDAYNTTWKIAAVPLPSAAWLLGSSLLGLVGAGYRRKSA